ncbi:MAG TPA: VCBS repeat-containing protein [Verrucomicrobiae bacterium]
MSSAPGAADAVSFGFAGPETFPIDPAITQLRAADMDGDGLMDLIVVNNARARINILYNQTGKTNAVVKAAVKREMNELPPDARFRIDSVASEKRIAAFTVEDLNHDKRPDLIYYGEPKELVVQYNLGSNGWSNPKRWPIEDGVLSPNGLASGDVSGDGLPDLVLLGENTLYVLTQQKDGTLGEPEKIPFSGLVKSAQVLDINGDGRQDLMLVNWDTPNPVRFRLQAKSGQMGPEIHFSMPPIRSYWADDLDADSRTEVITIAQNSGRAQIANFTTTNAQKLSGTFAEGQFQILPLNKTTKAKRGQTWADVNNDALPDLLVSEPESGQFTIYLQQTNGTLATGKTFSTLVGVSEIAVGDWDGKQNIFLLSGDERAIGITRLDDKGKVAFPTMLPIEGRPLAMALGKITKEAKPTLAAILDQEGKRALILRTAGSTGSVQRLSPDFKSNPSAMMWHDVNQDGHADLVVLIPYEKIKILLNRPGKDFEEVDVQAPGGALEQPWMTSTDVDGDGKAELLLPQRNFLRAVVLKIENADADPRSWSFVVKDQINGAANNSRLIGATSVRNGTNAVNSLFLFDAEKKAVTLSERSTNGAWEIVRNIALPFTEFTELQPLSLGGQKPNAVAFMGLNAAAWLPLFGDTWQLTELDGYETSIKDGRLNDVVTGDLNGDGRKDLVFLETAKNYLDLVILDKNRKLVPANRWPVFEERSFRSRRGESQEPREALIADFTGDGKNDLAIIVHDRVLVYTQE